jgi:hypothetical protein
MEVWAAGAERYDFEGQIIPSVVQRPEPLRIIEMEDQTEA